MFGWRGVFGHIVLAKHQRHSHGNDAERRQQQQAAGIAADMVLDPAPCGRPRESREVADRIDHGDSGGGRGGGEEGGGQRPNTGRLAKPATQREIIFSVGLSTAVETAIQAAAINVANATWNRRSTTRSERRRISMMRAIHLRAPNGPAAGWTALEHEIRNEKDAGAGTERGLRQTDVLVHLERAKPTQATRNGTPPGDFRRCAFLRRSYRFRSMGLLPSSL